MIQRLRLSHFQNHSATQIDFAPGVTVITGPSDQGKSAIIRAINWVLFNRPSGDGFRQEGFDEVRAALTLDNATITRLRTKKQNLYRRNMDGTALEFAALRTDVPEEIRAAANIADAQVHNQHDPIFLLQDSPGEVAKKLNTLVGLDLDAMFARANRIVNDAKQTEQTASAQAEKITQELTAYAYLEGVEPLIAALEAKETERTQVQARAQALRTAIRTAESSQARLDKFPDPAPLQAEADALQKKLARATELRASAQELRTAAADVRGLNEDLTAHDADLAEDTARLAEIKTALKVCPTCSKPW